jgi:L-rhamnose mutarotase
MSVKRIASVIRLRENCEEEYRKLHREVWPDVLAALKVAGVSNYSIYLRDGLLFSYMEFSGESFETALGEIARDEATQQWWALTSPCQEPLDTAEPGEWWVPVDEVFHLD